MMRVLPPGSFILRRQRRPALPSLKCVWAGCLRKSGGTPSGAADLPQAGGAAILGSMYQDLARRPNVSNQFTPERSR